MFFFLVLLLMYLPVAAVGYFLLGNNLKDNVLLSLQEHSDWMFYTVQVLICVHLLSAFTIILNPLCQELEKLLKLPLRKSVDHSLSCFNVLVFTVTTI